MHVIPVIELLSHDLLKRMGQGPSRELASGSFQLVNWCKLMAKLHGDSHWNIKNMLSEWSTEKEKSFWASKTCEKTEIFEQNVFFARYIAPTFVKYHIRILVVR